jgi:chromosome segregation ATPase
MSEDKIERIIEDEQSIFQGELTQLEGILAEIDEKIDALQVQKKKMQTLSNVFTSALEGIQHDLKQVEFDFEKAPPESD